MLYSVLIMVAICVWCRVLRVFSAPSDLLPNLVLDLRTAHVRLAVHAHVVIKFMFYCCF